MLKTEEWVLERLVDADILRSQLEAVKGAYDRDKERMRKLEAATLEELSNLGYIVIREGDTISNYVNEPSFIRWIHWAMTDGWEQLTASTFQVGPYPEQPNRDAELLKERLGAIRKELELE